MTHLKAYTTTVVTKNKLGEDIWSDEQTSQFVSILSTKGKSIIITDGVCVYAVRIKEDKPIVEVVEESLRNKHSEKTQVLSVESSSFTPTDEEIKRLDAMERSKDVANKHLKKMEKFEAEFNKAQDEYSSLFRTEKQRKNLEESEQALKEYYAKLEENNRIAIETALRTKQENAKI